MLLSDIFVIQHRVQQIGVIAKSKCLEQQSIRYRVEAEIILVIYTQLPREMHIAAAAHRLFFSTRTQGKW